MLIFPSFQLYIQVSLKGPMPKTIQLPKFIKASSDIMGMNVTVKLSNYRGVQIQEEQVSTSSK